MRADLTPAANRATASYAKALNPVIEPCLSGTLAEALSQIQQLFPQATACMAAAATGSSAIVTRGLADPAGGSDVTPILQIAKPRVIMLGSAGCGLQQLSAAVLAALEGLPVHCIGLTSLLSNVAAR